MAKPPYLRSFSDEDLMNLVREENCAAFDVLHDRHHDQVLRWFLQKMGPRFRSDAEDLTQAVFLRVFEKRSTYRPGGTFRPWLYRIVLTTRANFFRQAENRIRRMLEAVQEELPSPLSERFSLGYYLSKLPGVESDVLSLLIEGLSPDEVAEVLSLSLATVYRKRRQAHESIKLLLETTAPSLPGKVTNPSE